MVLASKKGGNLMFQMAITWWQDETFQNFLGKHTCLLALFIQDSQVHLKLNQERMFNFLWSGNKAKKGVHLASWESP